MRVTLTLPIVAMAQDGRSNQNKIGAKCWVVNLSHQPLSQAQETVLAHGPNFAVTPKTPLQRIHNSSRNGLPKP